MAIEEITTRLFRLIGTANIATAYSNDGKMQPVDKGRCLYLARFEFAPQDHPELKNHSFIHLTTTSYNLYSHHGRAQGEIVPYERLVEGKSISKAPSIRSLHSSIALNIAGDSNIFDLLPDVDEVVRTYSFDLNMVIYSEFDGYWQAFGNRYDPFATYTPVIMQAYREVLPLLKTSNLNN